MSTEINVDKYNSLVTQYCQQSDYIDVYIKTKQLEIDTLHEENQSKQGIIDTLQKENQSKQTENNLIKKEVKLNHLKINTLKEIVQKNISREKPKTHRQIKMSI